MSNADTETDILDEGRTKLLDAFAAAPERNDRQVALAPSMALSSESTAVGAQAVAVRRDEQDILRKLKIVASAAGTDFFYRFPVKNRRENRTDWIEGPSIKLANELARLYGNCEINTRVLDIGDSWIIYARFTDYETGFSMVRPFQQRKNQRSMKGDDARALDIALQIGVSKAIRNVVTNSLQTFADFTFEEARSALVDKIGTDLANWRTRTIEGLQRRDIELSRVEAVIGRTSKEWLAPDVARIIAMMKAIADGMATVDETFPAPDKHVDGEAAEQAATETKKEPSTDGKPAVAAGAQPASQAAPDQSSASPSSQGSATASADPGAAAVDNTKTKTTTDKKKTEEQFAPTSEAQYIAFANAWRGKLTDAGDGMKQWKSEKDLRNKCNVTPEVRDDLLKSLQEKCAALQKSEG
jgi:hypothetical protein